MMICSNLTAGYLMLCYYGVEQTPEGLKVEDSRGAMLNVLELLFLFLFLVLFLVLLITISLHI